jgi:hypothetical protein
VEFGLRYQVPKRIARAWLDDARLILLLDGLDEVPQDRRAACVEAINAFEEAHHPPGLAVTCRVAEYNAMTVKLRLRAAICLQPLTQEQIVRYFSAAGSGLDHLRQAMQDDAGLRELAQTPLMLSVMTMAWGNVPAGDVRGQSTGTIEERRRQLFEAYVQAAINRRGKSSGGYSAGQTVGWLAWLARRMKEHGHTLFAVEQLQPAWLETSRQQFGYFMATRLLGTIGLALPFLLADIALRPKLTLAVLSLLIGLAIGGVDYGFARRGWGGEKRATNRFFTLFFGFLIGGVAWISALAWLSRGDGLTGSLNAFYLFMAGFAFCQQLDVRALDVKPSASMRWSWQQALDRSAIGLVGTNAFLCFMFLVVFTVSVVSQGWGKTFTGVFGDGHFLVGFSVGAVIIAAIWTSFRPQRKARNVSVALTFAIIGGYLGVGLGNAADITSWIFLLFGLVPGLVMGVFGGFAPTLIDPARGRHAGVWFWLRVPVTMLFFVGFVTLLPGFVWIFRDWNVVPHSMSLKQIWGALAFAAGCGLVSFFRFGGFNGVQHFFLRWLLVRSGNLPPKAEVFYNHAAQLALLQRVGFGYRFIHALLLDHLAARAPEAARTTESSSN